MNFSFDDWVIRVLAAFYASGVGGCFVVVVIHGRLKHGMVFVGWISRVAA
jgi:hypothetical protein